MASIFTKIIQGEIPSYKLAENEDFFAFLDINPVVKGHALVIPKMEVDYIYDLPDETLSGLHLFAKGVAKAIEEVVPCERIGVMVAGLEVPHAHIHLIPINAIRDLSFSNPRVEMTKEEFERLAEKIAAAYSA